MENTQPKRHRRKTSVSAMTATLPIVGGGEVPMPADAPKRRRSTRKRKSIEAPVAPAATVLDHPARAIFAGVPVDVTAIGEKHVVVLHDKAIAPEGDLVLRIPGLFAELSRLGGRVKSTAGGASTIEITRNAIALAFALDAIQHPIERASNGGQPPPAVQRMILAPARALPDEVPVIEADPEPLPHPRDRRPPLVPVARTYIGPPRRERHWQGAAAAIGIVLLIVASIVAYIKRPDDHLERARKMIEAYEDGLMPSERDYTLPVYTSALRELGEVRPASVSESEAEKMAQHIRELIARQRAQRAVNASLLN